MINNCKAQGEAIQGNRSPYYIGCVMLHFFMKCSTQRLSPYTLLSCYCHLSSSYLYSVLRSGLPLCTLASPKSSTSCFMCACVCMAVQEWEKHLTAITEAESLQVSPSMFALLLAPTLTQLYTFESSSIYLDWVFLVMNSLTPNYNQA